MIMREKIAEIIRGGELRLSYHGIADAIIAVLPDYDAQQARITELEAARDLGIIEGDVVAQLLVVAQQAQIEGLEATLQQERSAKWRLAENPLKNRVEELEAALGEFARFASRKEKSGASVPFGQSKLHAARAVLKGEKT